ncbi:MAG: hypothetical protein IJ728_13230, partial [Selenomonadaceae bacterium]|nr:hypothetical protein [Selenomonadaceae bacterium]
LLSVCDDGWSGASNIATLKSNNQVLDGDILVGSDSTLYLNVSDSSTLKGSISGKISNASGSSVSTSLGTVNVTLDSSSKWYLEENTYISSFSGTAANVITGSYKLYVNGTALSGTSTSDSGSSDDTLTSGLTYNSAKTAVTVDSDYDEATLSSYESTVVTIDASSRSTALAIIGNAKANVISGGSGADTINGGKGADTLTGNGGADVFLYASGTGNDVITDYVSGTDKIKITSGSISKSTVNGSDVVLTIGSGKLTIKNAKGKTLNLINSAGTESTTVIGTSTSEDDPEAVIVTNSTSATVTVDSSIKTIDASTRSKSVKITGNSLNNTIFGGTGVDTINGGSGNDSIIGSSGNDKLYGDEGNDSIYGGVGNDTLNGDAGNDYLSGDAGTDKLYGGDGADTLAGGKGNDSLTGGNGADVFVFGTGDGTDVILDYEPGTDKIKISSGSITSSSISGNNTIFKIGSAKLTVKNSAGSAIDIVDADGNETSQTYGMLTYNSAKTLLTVNKSFTGTLDYTDYASTVTKINASKVTNSIYAIGNAKNNSIKTGTGDDTLDGGSDGNDTLTGGKGSDVFIYRGGNDLITDYTAGEDTIKIASGTIDTYAIKSSNVVLTIGDNTLTIKNAKNK